MSCNCVNENSRKIAEYVGARLCIHPDDVTASPDGVAFTLGEKPGQRPFMPYTVRANAPGYRSQKGKQVNMFFTFCPWCGTKLEEAK